MDFNSYQVAELMGINVSTVKRLTESGKLNCQKTQGGHRKFYLSDLKDFLKKNKKNVANINLEYLIGNNQSLINAINQKDNNKLINHCFKSLISNKPDEFTSFINALSLKGYTIDIIFDEYIIPVLIKIGEKWSKNTLSITEEHIATERIRKFASNLSLNTNYKRTKYNAYCFTLADDQHDLPTYMAEAVFNQNKNIKTFNLGRSIPIDDFIKVSKKTDPKIIFISFVYTDKYKLVEEELNLICKTFNNSDVKIFLRGSLPENIKVTYNNLIQIESFKQLSKEILKY
jgi:excisionase family DNA binding protein